MGAGWMPDHDSSLSASSGLCYRGVPTRPWSRRAPQRRSRLSAKDVGLTMIGHRGAFLLASCAAPLVPLTALGIRSTREPMKLFGPACVPIYIAIWACVCAAAYAAARLLATWVRSSTPQVGRSAYLSVTVGLLLGLAVTFFGNYWPWSLGAVVALGPVLFRTQYAATQHS